MLAAMPERQYGSGKGAMTEEEVRECFYEAYPERRFELGG